MVTIANSFLELFAGRREKSVEKKKKKFLPMNIKRVFICDEERYDLPFHYYGRLYFSTSEFLKTPHLYRLVVLTGGEDLSPTLYGHRVNVRAGEPNFSRDAKDLLVAMTAIRCGIPIVGVCRGAQLLNIIAGGYLIQDCDNHRVWHDIVTKDGDVVEVSSTHHQMMVPPKDESTYELIAWAHPSRSKNCYIQSNKHPVKPPVQEPDCLYYPALKGLAMQYHPEYMEYASPAFELAGSLIEKYLGLQKIPRQLRDRFISLPKPKKTTLRERIESKLYNGMNKRTRVKFNGRLFLEEFMLNKTRKYQTQLMPKKQAAALAHKELEEILTNIKDADAPKDAVRASGVSE